MNLLERATIETVRPGDSVIVIRDAAGRALDDWCYQTYTDRTGQLAAEGFPIAQRLIADLAGGVVYRVEHRRSVMRHALDLVPPSGSMKRAVRDLIDDSKDHPADGFCTECDTPAPCPVRYYGEKFAISILVDAGEL